MTYTALPPSEFGGLHVRAPAVKAGIDPWPTVRVHIRAGTIVSGALRPAWIVGDAVAGVIGGFAIGVAESGNWWVVGAAGLNGQVGTFVLGDGAVGTDLDAWSEVTCDLEEWELSQRALKSLDQFDAASLTFRLDNLHRYYDPRNADSPYNVLLADGSIDAGLRPGTPVTITATWDGVAYPLFTGEVDSVDDRMSYAGARQVEVRATDGFAVFGAYDAEAQAVQGSGELADARIARILDMVGWPATMRRLSGTCTVPLQETTLAGNALSMCKQAAASEGGRVWIDGAGNVVLESHADVYSLPVSQFVQFEVGDDMPAAPDFGLLNDREQVVNRVSYARVGGTAVTVANTESSNRYRVRSAQRSDLICSYDVDVESLARRDLAVQAFNAERLSKLTPALSDTRWWRHVLGWRPRYRADVSYSPGTGGGGWGSGVWGDGTWGEDGDPVVHRCYVDGRTITASPARWDVEFQLVDASGWSVWTVGDPVSGRVGMYPIAW